MSAAVELRAAASKLRELAQRATPGPWDWRGVVCAVLAAAGLRGAE